MKLRIGSFTHYTGLYGANRSLLALIDGSRADRSSFYVFAPSEGPITEALADRNIPYHVAPYKKWMSAGEKGPRATFSRFRKTVATLPSIVSKVEEWEVDLLHTNSSVMPVGAIVAEIARCPHVWHIREFGDLDYNLSFDWPESVSRLLLRRADARVAVSEAVGSHVCGSRDLPYRVVYNGVFSEHNLERLQNRVGKSNRFSAPFTFAIVGLLQEAKGQRQALKAIKQLRESGRDVRLLIAGSGGDLEVLQRLTRTLGVEEEVDFLGFVEDPFEVYANSNAVLMCSPNEAMGRVTAEAMMARRPVIGYNNKGTKEIIDHNENGLLYNGNVDDLVYKMSTLIDNPEMLNRYGQEAFRKAKSMYTHEVYANQMNEIFSSVC